MSSFLVQLVRAAKSATTLLIVWEENIYDSAIMIMMYLASVKNAKVSQDDATYTRIVTIVKQYVH